jgi:hypothetical protein
MDLITIIRVKFVDKRSGLGLGLWYLTPLSPIFQLYGGETGVPADLQQALTNFIT